MCLLVQWVILKITGRKSLDTWWGNPCQLCYFHFQKIGDGQLDLYLEHVDAWSTPDRFSMHYVTLLTVHSLRSLACCMEFCTLMHFKCRFRFPNGPIWTRILLIKYMWLELALLRCSYANVQCSWHSSTGFWFSVFQRASSMPGLGHSTDIAPSGIQYSRKPCECLDLDIQLAFHWELKSHLFKDWCFQLSHMSLEFGEVTWKAHIGRFSRRSWRCIWCLMLKCIFQKPIIFCWPNLKDVPYSLHALKLTIGS